MNCYRTEYLITSPSENLEINEMKIRIAHSFKYFSSINQRDGSSESNIELRIMRASY